MKTNKSIAIIGSLVALLGLNACSDSDDDDTDNVMNSVTEQTYRITVSNLTNGQPLTPIGVILHTPEFSAWETVEPVSTGLEMLAESGDPSQFLSESETEVIATASGATPFGPGSQQTISITIEATENLQLSLATMLANTNDAFTGITNWDISDLDVDDSKSVMPHVYDAGTEANTETATTMPGPAANGEGFNTDRTEDIDKVTIHPGVVTTDDGLTASALNESHRWLGSAAKIVITRTQ
ncbi:MAG: hypothetical protein GXP08_07835 [Gammaproteobacteria bacterium]|nr:hypothetical protein [Gammaproteobacteria bacterium]